MPPLATPRLLIESRRAGTGFESAGPSATWADAPAGPPAHPWDQAHRAVRGGTGFEVAGDPPAYAEPDFTQAFPFPRADSGGFESAAVNPCDDRAPDLEWSPIPAKHGWHLDDAHSQLKAAREFVGDPGDPRIRIAHLDTGYDPDHRSRPRHIDVNWQRNFVGGDVRDATDPDRHGFNRNPGHGTATLALLAGNRTNAGGGFDDDIGGAPHAEVVPIRIANSVIHFETSGMAAGINHAVDAGCHVLSVSMGGVPSRAWAAAVNRAYEAGLAMFAAAGNRFGPLPPTSTVWPARFGRVTAVCGVTAAGTPYYKPGIHRQMQGCFGPEEKMPTAIAAYTPNCPWAIIKCPESVGFGGGTSSATPQAAAAAALWLAKHPAPAGTQPWQRVEAVRHALFSTADRDYPDYAEYYGNGAIKARKALDVPFRTDLPITPPDEVSFPWIRLINPFESTTESGTAHMYEVEALQAFLSSPELHALAKGVDPISGKLSPADRKAFLNALAQSRGISEALRAHVNEILRTGG